MVVELLSVGTELLMGSIVNTNAQFLAERCARLGVSVFCQTVVGDNPGSGYGGFQVGYGYPHRRAGAYGG
jgi:molybdopterin biosynthesis enzyme